MLGPAAFAGRIAQEVPAAQAKAEGAKRGRLHGAAGSPTRPSERANMAAWARF